MSIKGMINEWQPDKQFYLGQMASLEKAFPDPTAQGAVELGGLVPETPNKHVSCFMYSY